MSKDLFYGIHILIYRLKWDYFICSVSLGALRPCTYIYHCLTRPKFWPIYTNTETFFLRPNFLIPIPRLSKNCHESRDWDQDRDFWRLTTIRDVYRLLLATFGNFFFATFDNVWQLFTNLLYVSACFSSLGYFFLGLYWKILRALGCKRIVFSTVWRDQNFDRYQYRDFLSETNFSDTGTKTFFRDQIFRYRYRDY